MARSDLEEVLRRLESSRHQSALLRDKTKASGLQPARYHSSLHGRLPESRRHFEHVPHDVRRAGQVLGQGGTYSILLEATDQQRLEPNFTLCLTFVDASGQIYEQNFGLTPLQTLSVKRTKRR